MRKHPGTDRDRRPGTETSTETGRAAIQIACTAPQAEAIASPAPERERTQS